MYNDECIRGEVTHQIGARFGFEIDNAPSWYSVQLAEAPIDTLIFAEEYFELIHQSQKLGTVHKESLFFKSKPSDHASTDQKVQHDLERYSVFHFHNTAETAKCVVTVNSITTII